MSDAASETLAVRDDSKTVWQSDDDMHSERVFIVPGGVGIVVHGYGIIMPPSNWLAAGSRRWQPIDTAPKDGTYVLLIRATQKIPTVAFWNRDLQTWDDGDFFDNINGLTHWQPLPDPPVSP